MSDIIRYGVSSDTEKREVVLLRSSGCSWGKCSFCDYQHDKNPNMLHNIKMNSAVLRNVQGKLIGVNKLQVIDSASFAELPFSTVHEIREICTLHGINKVIFEGHWMYRDCIRDFRGFFGNRRIETEFICGVETFDYDYREKVLCKGMSSVFPQQIATYFERVNLLYGMPGQTIEMLERDIELGSWFFSKIGLNLFTNNSTPIERQQNLIEEFYNSNLFGKCVRDPRVEIIDYADSRAIDHIGGVGNKKGGER